MKIFIQSISSQSKHEKKQIILQNVNIAKYEKIKTKDKNVKRNILKKLRNNDKYKNSFQNVQLFMELWKFEKNVRTTFSKT